MFAVLADGAGPYFVKPFFIYPFVTAISTGTDNAIIIHDIGKNIVAMMMSLSGFEVLDLGVDVPGEKSLPKRRHLERIL